MSTSHELILCALILVAFLGLVRVVRNARRPNWRDLGGGFRDMRPEACGRCGHGDWAHDSACEDCPRERRCVGFIPTKKPVER